MTKIDLFFFALALGAILGGIFVAWVSWTYLHQKIEQLDFSIRARLNALENSLLAKVHLVRPQPAPAPQSPATNSSAAAPTPPAGDASHSG